MQNTTNTDFSDILKRLRPQENDLEMTSFSNDPGPSTSLDENTPILKSQVLRNSNYKEDYFSILSSSEEEL